ncbi:Tyrosine kinase [Entamoeba marina]
MLSVVYYLFILLVHSQSIDNCIEQYPSGICKTCSDGYFLFVVEAHENSSVLNCLFIEPIDNCIEYEGEFCIQCSDGYYVDDETNSCFACSSNCLHCNSTHCNQCYSSPIYYYLSSDQKTCIDCSQSINDEICGRCPQQYFYDSSLKQCSSCKTNCLSCTNSSNCYQCIDGYYLTGSIGNEECQIINNCESSYISQNGCLKCITGYQLINGICLECSNDCKDCLFNDLNELLNCSICNDGFVNYNGNCISLSTFHCSNGSTTQGCYDCENGYFMNELWVCQQCDSSCSTCIQNSTYCIDCSTNYYKNKNGLTCEKVDENCDVFDQWGCLKCKSVDEVLDNYGYYIPENSQTCQQCNDHCTVCSDEPYYCNECSTGYVLKYNTTASTSLKSRYYCDQKEDSCKTTLFGYCIECLEHYFLVGDENNGITCLQCHESCSVCSNTYSCITCDDGYYLPKELFGTNSTCRDVIEINMTCETSTMGCLECKESFYRKTKDDYNCTECPTNCLNCTYSTTVESVICLSCKTNSEYVEDGKCVSCDLIDNCESCNSKGCIQCDDGYELNDNTCSRLGIVSVAASFSIFGFVVIISVLSFLIKFDSYQLLDQNRLLLSLANNKSFPLKKCKFLCVGVDEISKQTITFTNPKTSLQSYTLTSSKQTTHQYSLELEPNTEKVEPGNNVDIELTLIPLCTCRVNDEIPLTCIHNNKTYYSKLIIHFETEPSFKLDYTELKSIGNAIDENEFGFILKGDYRGKTVAIKKIKDTLLSKESESDFLHEVEILQQLQNSRIIEYIGSVFTDGEMAIVTEYAPFGSVIGIWKQYDLPFELKVKIAHDTASALDYLHNFKYIHRNIKSENVLLFNVDAQAHICGKLTSFGDCINFNGEGSTIEDSNQNVGDILYKSPETITQNIYSDKTDVFSFGVMLYEIYNETTIEKVWNTKFNEKWKVPMFISKGNRLEKVQGMPNCYWECIEDCWNQISIKRPNTNQIKEMLIGMCGIGDVNFLTEEENSENTDVILNSTNDNISDLGLVFSVDVPNENSSSDSSISIKVEGISDQNSPTKSKENGTSLENIAHSNSMDENDK